ncbi:MAG TPA: beta-ketoacyl-[acyl-carrier-protein] synthase family protein [Candidatus Angelobacter sp.]|nr:beta-ketoacyl-[acyl-carrier-protein] synthase family protein [Candidatus Angelobacter sp.]
MREVVITGAGVVSSLGRSVPEFSRRMFAGESGASAIRGTLVASNFPVPVGAPVPRTTLGQPAIFRDRDPENTPHFLRMTGLATEEAVQSLPEGLPVDSIVYGGHGSVAFNLIEDSFRTFDPQKFDWDAFQPESALDLIRKIAELRGHGPIHDRDLISLSNACVTSNQAIGMAFQRIRSGQWNRVITGAMYGRFAASEVMNFHMLGTLTTADRPATEASRPFSRDRSGFVLGEGAATFILEAREAAESRGATILGMVRGYAATSDAYRVTDGRPDGKVAAQAMLDAIEDAGLTPEQIQAISAHGTSTPMNDRIETLAIKRAFGTLAYGIPVVSLKSQVGHAVVAAGALEAIACLQMLSEQRLAPTINYGEADPQCDLDYVPNQSRPATLERILSNNFGFGGQNACVVFERSPEVLNRDAAPRSM